MKYVIPAIIFCAAAIGAVQLLSSDPRDFLESLAILGAIGVAIVVVGNVVKIANRVDDTSKRE
jgi:hypothetical protein